MTFPTGTSINTTNLDSGTDDPSLARADIYDAVVALNNIIASADTAQGVALLSASNKYDGTKFPTTIAVTGTQTLAPTSGVVNIQDVLRLTALPSSSITSLASPQLGDIAISTNADGGSPAVCFYDGADWTYLGFGNLSVL